MANVVAAGVRRARGLAGRLGQQAAEELAVRVRMVEERRLLHQLRDGRDVCWPDGAEDEPLVTVRIAAYDRGRVVADRALASAVAQTYERLEILVVGDHCTPDTAAAIRSVRDPRIRFVDLPTHGVYPPGAAARRKVAGSYPMNAARYLAAGSWIAPLDDDDEFTADHVEVLLRHAIDRRLEMVWSRSELEVSPGRFRLVGSEPLRMGEITHGSVLFSGGLRFLSHSNTSWKRKVPSDWDLWWRMEHIGVRMGFLPRLTFRAHLGSAGRSVLVADGAEPQPDAPTPSH